MDQNLDQLIARRSGVMGQNVTLFYDEPVHIVRARGVRLWDEKGREYLDCYNNVPCIGHCHPKYVAAVSNQLETLNTHTRYLHEGIICYLEELCNTFNSGFDSGILTCTGSEANDIAIRTAWVVTGKRGIIATDHTYHGNTHLVSQLSKKKIPIGGHESFVRHIPAPDSYRGANSSEFAANVKSAIKDLNSSNDGFAALIICPLFANEGFPEINHGWLEETQAIVKSLGGLLICDEVQSGFGRTGQMWAHERMGVVPDIVTLGKPMASGYPVGGVISHSENINAFRKAYGYFNTFGGNPVSVAAAQTTLDILQDEGLAENAQDVGFYVKDRLKNLAKAFEIIGDVRGSGLFFGAEFVGSKSDKIPDADRAQRIVNAMRNQGVLMNVLGIHHNTLKIRPPLVFTKDDADELIGKLETVIAKDVNG